MKTNSTQFLLAAALVLAGSAFAQQTEAPVRIKTDGLSADMRDRLEAKAQQGLPALIQYVNRTRMIYQLRVQDLVISEEDTARAEAQKALVARKERVPDKN